MVDEHELMHDFNKNFQVYTDVRFLKFNMEKSLKKPVHALDVYISKSVPLIYRKYRYMVPIAISINGQPRTTIDTIIKLLGFIPLFKLICNDDVMMINLEDTRRSYKLVGADEYKESTRTIVRDFNIKYNDVGSDDSKLERAKSELDRLNIEYEETKNILEIKDQKVIITQLSTFILPDKYMNDYLVVAPDVRYLYKMRLQNDEQGNRFVSLGFVIRRGSEDIIIHPEDNRVIISDGRIVEA